MFSFLSELYELTTSNATPYMDFYHYNIVLGYARDGETLRTIWERFKRSDEYKEKYSHFTLDSWTDAYTHYNPE